MVEAVVRERERNQAHVDTCVCHPDGRQVRFANFGAPELKRVVFYSHGFPASRIEASVAHKIASELGLSIVAIDRPGFGGSDWYADRKIEDWAKDVELVAHYLGVSSFGVLGVSGGTPTAVGVAALLHERVSRLVIVSGVAPVQAAGALRGMHLVNRVLISLGMASSKAGGLCIGLVAWLWRSVPLVFELWFAAVLPEVDLKIVRRPSVGAVLARNVDAALSQGVRGVVTEFGLLISDWRGLLPQVKVPVSIWHGEADTYVSIAMGEVLNKSIPHSSFKRIVGGGHFMLVDRMREVLEEFAVGS